jgi:tight adherence protein C
MSAQVMLGAAAVASSIPILWWSAGGRLVSKRVVARNLASGFAPVNDLRQISLARPAALRTIGPLMQTMVGRVRRVTPGALIDGLERRINLAGLASSWPLERVLATKVLLGVVALLLGVVRLVANPSVGALLLAVLLAGAAYFMPDYILYSKAKKRQQEIQRELADTLDQITISVEAGLGFEAAMARTAQYGKGPLADEMRRTLQDIQIGMARGDALRGLVARTDVPELRHFVLALLQAEAFGVPIAQVLRIQSAELRDKRKMRAEERAMKMPVKIVFPLVLCILPSLFIVILGPAVIRIYHAIIEGT